MRKNIALLVSLCAISFMCLGFSGCQVLQGEKGEKGEQGIQGIQGEAGKDGKDGETPTVEIGEDGYWVINGQKTNCLAIGKDGQDGSNGKDGQNGTDGKDGADGENGRGIESVSYDEEGNLVIVYTDKTSQTIALPEKEEHVHTYGTMHLLNNSNYCNERLGWRSCSECGYVEWSDKGVDHVWNETYSYHSDCHYRKCKNCPVMKDYGEHELDENGVCTVCDVLIGTEGLIYEVVADGGMYAKVVGYTGTSETVAIPNRYNEGYPVKTITQNAFMGNKNITKVRISSSVTEIEEFAFYGCLNVTDFTVDENNENYQSIDGNLYSKDGTTLINYAAGKTDAEFVMPDSVKEIHWRALSYCKGFKSVTISSSVKKIGQYTFYRCTGLESVAIPNSVTELGEGAFFVCTALKSVTIPASVTSIGSCAFTDCFSLSEIKVEENNQYYKSVEGNLYSKDGKTFIRYAIGKTETEFLTMSGTVTVIGESAFEGAKALTKVKIPSSVTTIEELAFYDCKNLTQITIPESVTLIEWGAFDFEFLKEAVFEITTGWKSFTDEELNDGEEVPSSDLEDEETAALYLTDTYWGIWKRV